MLRAPCSLVVIVLCLNLSVLAFSQATPPSVPEPEVIYGATSVEWPTTVPDAGVLLTISGPAGLYLRQENPAGSWGRFSLTDEQGEPRPNGIYKWHLVVQAGWDGAEHATQSGWFQIHNGKVVAERIGGRQPVVVEEQAPASSLYVDSQGRVGLGTSVPASQLHLKGILPALTLEDTTAGGGTFTFRAFEKGDGSLALFDQAGQARWFVDSEGRMGIGTTKPTSALTVDGYIESTKGFLVNGKPVGGTGFGLIGGSQPLSTETGNNNYFGDNAGGAAGDYNSFFGASAGDVNTGHHNNFFGFMAGMVNSTGSYNDFFGFRAGGSNITGFNNSFFGSMAGFSNTTGSLNSFFGADAGRSNTSGLYNSFFGPQAGYYNETGEANSFFGSFAGGSNTAESNNTLVGFHADLRGVMPGASPVDNATAIGAYAFVAQPNSLVLGSVAGVNSATSYVNVGIGTTTPARQLHVAGPNAVFRMDRTTDTASFILVRTDPTGVTPWKTFVVGTNATGVNQGEFIVNDIGTAVGGGGNRRMTISNEGNVQFTGIVSAFGYASSSSLAFKTNIRTFENALETISRLRGVRFDWKDSGKPAVGLIAEEVNEVVPEVVAQENGNARGVNYDNLVAVLVEAVKEQQKTNEEQRATFAKELDRLNQKVARLEALLQGK